ncbi:MAG: DNA polymerase III subunit alpha [Chloroflexota bacterium]
MADFAHLHVHSEYSLLDGYSAVKDLVKHAAKLHMPALALTDHGSMYGAIEFYEAARDAGVKPIIGVETYVAPGKMTARGAQEREYAHLILLAQDDRGYRNLLKLVTKANLEGFYYKPRIDRDLLAECHEGLIALSACFAGEPSAAVLRDDPATARANAAWYRDVFGDRYYLELQNHGSELDVKNNRGLLEISRELGIPVVATNDSHYTSQDQADAQDLLLCVQTNSTLDDPKRMRMQPDAFYLKTAEEMAALFAETPEAISNTLAIAERCNLDLKFGRLNFPPLDHVIPAGENPDDFLARVCRERIPSRYASAGDEVRQRLEYELDVVRTTGFASYIIFVWDFVDWARKQKILCGPRGSAAGSIILYLLGIADIDPVEYGLTFERFLNPERVQMPDVDMDFADDRRDDVINYCIERYGRDHVAQIVTFGRMLPRAALRDVGRVLSYPLSEVDRVAKLIPSVPVGMKMEQALQQVNELGQLYETDPAVRRLIDAAKKLEGVARHASTHAAGVVVAGDPLVQHVPLQRVGKSDTMVMTQYPQKSLEQIGLLKMDFLGLANLTMLEKAVEYVAETQGVELDLGTLPLDDELTFEKLSNGETHSIFQLEGSGMTRYVKDLKPRTIRHLAAMVALYRPGPMAHIPAYIARKEGRQPVEYPDPSLEELLEESYGIIVYQDQVLQIVQRVAGYSLGQADILRRAMGKKEPEVMRKERERFINGALEQSYAREVADRLWEYIEPFAGYAFNKSHAFCYAFIAYQTAYLKANYPVEWMAAVLTTDALKTDKVVSAIGECRRLGIPLLRPDINASHARFTVEQVKLNAMERRLGIRYGLAAVKNVGEGAVESLIAERQKNGPFKSLEDFCGRVDLRTLNKRVIESLVKCGAFDEFGPRESQLAGVDQCMAAGQSRQKAAGVGQVSMFDMGGVEEPSMATVLPDVPPAALREKLAWEKETLGLYLSDHPFQEAARWLGGRVTADTSQIGPDLGEETVVIAGVISSLRRITTRKGDTMVVAQLEDLHGTADVVAFPRTYAATAESWREDAILIVEGKVDTRDDRNQVIVDAIEEWQPPADGEAPPEPVSSDAVRSAPPATATTGVAWAPMRSGAASNGNGNGHAKTNGNGHAKANGNGNGAHKTGPETPARIRLVVRRTEDEVADIKKLERLQHLLDEDGQSPYEVIVALDTERYRVSAADARTRFSARLEQELRELLGDAQVEVAPAQR